jgi:hypothetical protein
MSKLRTPDIAGPEATEVARLFPVAQEGTGTEITSQQMDEYFKLLVDSRNNYPDHWQQLTEQLKELHTANPDNIRFGPTYRIGAEHPVTVMTMFFDYNGAPPASSGVTSA